VFAGSATSDLHSRPFLMSDRAIRRSIVFCFFASGAAGLVYQVLWTRQLSLIFGVTTYAVATVLATFMGGLALGSFVLGRMVDRSRNPLAWYALLELGIGLYALVVTPLFHSLRVPYVALHGLEGSYATLAALRALLAALVLLPPTTMMGGTFPALTRYWVRASADIGRGAGLLYFVNTSGAIAGCLLTGFIMLEHLGLSGTTKVASVLNISVALVALFLSRSQPEVASPETSASDTALPGRLSRSAVTFALVCAGLSGFVSLAHEVLWSRALLRYLYNSTYAFTTMLATFLLGIAMGSAVYARWLHRVRRPLLLLGALQMLVGVGFLASSIVFPHLPYITDLLAGGTRITSFAQSLSIMVLNAGLTLLLPTILLGASFPLATSLAAKRLSSLGSAVGVVYAINTFGAILGSVGTGFVLIPTLGMRGTLTVLIVLSVAGGGALALAAVQRPAARLTTIACTAALLAVTLWSARDDVFRRTFAPSGRSLVYYREGATDSVAVVEHLGQRVIMYDDRRGTAGTNSFRANYFFGHLPILLHPGVPRRVLHICFGVGNSLSAVAAHDDVEDVDSVELSPHVVEAAPYFWTNSGVIAHPKVRTIIDDGRNYVMASRQTYDVIVLEPPETFTAGVINLYTPEFYRDVLERLAPDGIMMQWIPTGASPIEQERMLFRAFSDVFPHVTVWRQLNSGCLLLIGTRAPLTIDYQRLRARMAEPRVRRDMDLSGVRDADHLLSFLIFDEPGLAAFVRDATPVTDDRTVLDFTIPRYLGSGFGLGSWNVRAQRDGRNPFGEAMLRMNFYVKQRRSALPLLTNLGGEAPQAIGRRIAASAIIRIPLDYVPEAKWRRW
jgi:spermidine synthase